MESALALLGATGPEEADADELEHIMDYMSRPLRLNSESVEVLLSSGLLTRYQAMSLADYRARHGNVMSYAELASIDGFGSEYARHLEIFTTLAVNGKESTCCAGNTKSDIVTRSGTKASEEFLWSYGIKARSSNGERWSAALSASSAYNTTIRLPDAFSACFSYRFRRIPLHLVTGDFNARFGQGLALWNGMTMSGVSSPDSFMRSAGGITETWSFSGSSAHTGVAAEMSVNNIRLASMIAMPGIKYGDMSVLPAINITCRHKYFQTGLTHYCEYSLKEEWEGMKTSADIAACFRGTDIFGEIAFDWANTTTAGLAGACFRCTEDLKISAMLRYYPSCYDSKWSGAVRSRTKCSNEHSISIGCSLLAGKSIRKTGSEGFGADVRRHSATFSADVAYLPAPVSAGYKNMQVKLHADWKVMVCGSLQLKTRISERIRTWDHSIRSDFRLDATWFSSRFNITSRINVLHNRNTAVLAYLEGAYKVKKTGLYLRQGIFIVDEWDDRIYAYEKDAPGSFNVPAFYGRGVWTSFYGSWRISRSMRLDLRASLTAYPLMKRRKPGKAELKLQYSFSF